MSNFLTYNNIIDILKDVATRHQQVNTFFLGKDYDLENDGDIQYPLLQVYPTLARMPRNSNGEYKTIEINLACKVVDLEQQSQNNERDVHSDTLQIAQDIINELNQHPYYNSSNVSILNDIQLENLEEFEDDMSAGWSFELSLQLVNNNTFCGLPFDPIEGLTYNGAVSTGYTYTSAFNCADLIECPIIVDLGDDITQINSILSGLTGSTFSGTTNYYSKFTSGGTISNGILYDNGAAGVFVAPPTDNASFSIVSPSGFYYPALGFYNNGGTPLGEISAYANSLYISGAGAPTTPLLVSSVVQFPYLYATANTLTYVDSNNVLGTVTLGAGLDLSTGGTLSVTASGATPVWSASVGSYSIQAINDTVIIATGSYAVAEGQGTAASGNAGAHSEGFFTTAYGDASHAEGYTTSSFGNYSHSEGYYTTSTGDFSHAEGTNSKTVGDSSHAEGFNTTAQGNTSHAEGYTTTAYGVNSHAEGDYSVASGLGSHAEGFGTHAFGENSHSEGYATAAFGLNSHSEGSITTASGDFSHSEGRLTTALGNSSHVEGQGTTALGTWSHAEGNYTIAFGENSHSEGITTTALGNQSHAGGSGSTASGQTSFVHGNDSIAGGSSTIVLGDNITGTTDNTVYTPDIVIDSSKVIKSANGGGELSLDASGSGDSIILSIDNSAHTDGQLYMSKGFFGTNLELSSFSTSATIDILTNDLGFKISGNDTMFGANNIKLYGDSKQIVINDDLINTEYEGLYFGYTSNGDRTGGLIIKNNLIGTRQSEITNNPIAFLNTVNSFADMNVVNSVVLGGDGLSATTSNTVYVPYLNIKNFTGNTAVAGLAIDASGNVVTGSTASNYSFTGGTVTGATNFTNGLTANSFSATTYLGLPTDVQITGFTYDNANQFSITNNTGGTLSVIANTFSGVTVNTQSNLYGVIATSFSGSTNRIVEAGASGLLASTRDLIDSFLTGGTPTTLLGTASNWSPAGVYTGASITGTYQSQQYYNSTYYFVCVDDNDWIRLARV